MNIIDLSGCEFTYDTGYIEPEEALSLIVDAVNKIDGVRRAQKLLLAAARIRSDPRWKGEGPPPSRNS